jgi:hypothetical protein
MVGSREKGGGGNEIHAPYACELYMQDYVVVVARSSMIYFDPI